jgi:cell division septal protein FtsQ
MIISLSSGRITIEEQADPSFDHEISTMKRTPFLTVALVAAVVGVGVLFSVWTYDAWGKQRAVHALAQQHVDRLAALRRHAADPDADAKTLWQELKQFVRDFPEQNVDADWL